MGVLYVDEALSLEQERRLYRHGISPYEHSAVYWQEIEQMQEEARRLDERGGRWLGEDRT